MSDRSEHTENTPSTADDATEVEEPTTSPEPESLPDGSGSNAGDDDTHDDVASGGGAG